MPAVIAMLIEAGRELAGEAAAGCSGRSSSELAATAAAVNAVGNWDMCTVACFTCSRSCMGQRQGGELPEGCGGGGEGGRGGAAEGELEAEVWEEVALLVNEEDCHVATLGDAW